MGSNRTKFSSLDAALHERGSATALARRLGISKTYLTEIRKGRRVPNLELAIRIAREARIPLESLIRHEGAAA